MMDALLVTPTSVLGVLKEVAVIGASIVGVWVAVQGLRAWREQLHGTTAYQVARDLMRAVYSMRIALQWVRNPWMDASEFPEDHDPLAGGAKRASASAFAFGNRWKRVDAASQLLDEAALEAEVLWGSQVRDVLSLLTQCRGRLWAGLKIYHDNLGTEVVGDLEHRRAELRRRNDCERLVFNTSSPERPDDFSQDLDQAVQAVEEVARPHLSKKHS